MKRKPDARVRFTEAERRALHKLAQHRSAPKKGTKKDTSYSKTDTTILNAIGLACEVAWARWFGVPWYQNEGRGGDHHRRGDLQLRTGTWAEVKGSRNPNVIDIPSSTGSGWWLLLGTWWDEETHGAVLWGYADPPLVGDQSTAGERETVNGQRLSFHRMRTDDFISTRDIRRATANLSRPRTAAGLRCPWCFVKPWPCKEPWCVRALEAREDR